MRAVVLAVVAVVAAGCARTADDYAGTPTARLCMDLINLPRGINREAWAEQVRRRGENCDRFAGVAVMERMARSADSDRASDALMRQGQFLMQQGQGGRPVVAPAQAPIMPVQTYCARDYWGGVNCTSR